MVNWGILKHPMNWLIVILMLVISGMIFNLIMEHWQGN